MKSKIKIIVSTLAVIIITGLSINKKTHKEYSLLIENIEALSQNEGGDHGEIDQTLIPYQILSSKNVIIWTNNGPITTKIPCCASSDSKYSGCAKGLDGC